MGRRGMGIELTESYYAQGVNNMRDAERYYFMNGADPTVRLQYQAADITPATLDDDKLETVSLFDLMGAAE